MISKEKLLEKVEQSEVNKELYWRAIRADVCPQCGGVLKKVQIGHGEYSRFPSICQVCKTEF